MPSLIKRNTFLLAPIFLLVTCISVVIGAGEAYKIGPEDVLEVNFWQDPKLNSTVRVGLDGNITLDIIGQIEAAGKTTEQLQDDIVRQISRLNKNISQAVVRVVTYNYNHVYVTGEVHTPGKLTFEAIPDLWSVINEAGGPTDFADLTRVTIVRGGEDAGKVEIVNVQQALATGTLNKLPKVRRLDTIELPQNITGLPSADLARSSEERRNVIYVVGAVVRPGPITYEDNIDVLEAIALAGGPAPNANLKKAKIVSKDGYYAQAMQLNLDKYTKSGTPSRYVLRKEDTIVLPEKSAGFLGVGLGTSIAVIGAVTSIILVIDRLSSNNNQ